MSQPPLDPGALLARHYALPDGTRVCLRLLRPRDQPGVRDLFAPHDLSLPDFELARLVHFDLTRRFALVATALIDTAERVVGLGVVDFAEDPRHPALLLVNEDLAEGLEPLLREALVGHARTLARARAA